MRTHVNVKLTWIKGTDPSLFNKHQAALSIYCDSCSKYTGTISDGEKDSTLLLFVFSNILKMIIL